MDAVDQQGWSEAVVDILVEFLEAATHSLLHSRRAYPQDIFERRRKYGVPVWMSRHPELNAYISEVLLRAKSLMEQGVVRRVLVCFFLEEEHVDQAPVERVAFDVRVEDDGDDSVDSTSLQDVEDQLRSALLQIQKSSAHLPTRQGCTFALHVEAHEGKEGQVGRHDATQDSGQSSPVRAALRGGKWVLAGSVAQGVVAEPGRLKIVPIKSVRGRGLSVNLSTEMGDCSV
ncbi:HORMA domain protein [Ectocarpus siliculosus]|uniref:HORMA domain protein n=1 Tax=Ectocarpus siliculosus TaxID=2880 RepID=D7FJL0_ECTSI|nr:HORMA domain protein [Ectocarpus siliculosus]|eukprot:CBJ29113.1 HORMA domain protein [Ectocarpus siliculosus]